LITNQTVGHQQLPINVCNCYVISKDKIQSNELWLDLILAWEAVSELQDVVVVMSIDFHYRASASIGEKNLTRVGKHWKT